MGGSCSSVGNSYSDCDNDYTVLYEQKITSVRLETRNQREWDANALRKSKLESDLCIHKFSQLSLG
jgi:hypothetical protein